MSRQLSRTDHSIRNIVVNSVTQMINFVLIFISRRVFIRILGAEILGINALFESILTALSLLDLGFGVAVAYSLYKPLADNDQQKIVNLMGFYAKVYRRLAAIIFLFGLAVVPFIPLIVKTTIPLTDLIIYYVILLASTSLSYLFIYKSIIITADQRNYVIRFYSAIFTIVRIIAQITVLIFLRNYIAWLVVHLLSVVGSNIFLANIADREYPFLKRKPKALPKKQRSEIIKDVKSLFLYKLSGVVINTSDNIIGSVFTGALAVGIYSNYYTIVGSVGTFIQSVVASLTASVGNLFLSKDVDKKYGIFKVTNLVTFLPTGIVSSWLFASMNEMIKVWVGESMLFPLWIVVIIVAIFYFQTTAAPLWSFRDGSGAFRQVKYVGLYMAIVNIILSIVFAIWLGFGGVLLATLVSRLVTVYWLEPLLLHKTVFKKSYLGYALMRLRFSAVIFIGGALNYLIIQSLHITGLKNIILSLLFSILIMLVMFFMVFRNSAEWKMVCSIFVEKILRGRQV